MKLLPLGGRGNEYLFRPVDSEIIWVSRFKKGFGRKQNSLQTENPIEARQLRDELFAKWLGERPKLSKKVRHLAGPLWDEWEATKYGKAPATQESIKYSGKHLKQFIDSMAPEEITEAWWLNTYIPAKRLESPKRTFGNEWKWLSSFLKYLHRNGKIKIKPLLENPDAPAEEGIFLSDSEIAAFYEHASPDLSLQIDLGFIHFMRRSEVLLLPYSEIDFKSAVINLPAHRTKIRKARSIPLNNAVLERMAARKRDSDSDFVFPSPKYPSSPIGRLGNATAWRAAIERANKEKVRINPAATFHDLRHSGLTRAFTATNRYAEICVVAGLSLEMAQKTYLHMKPEHLRFVSDLVGAKR